MEKFEIDVSKIKISGSEKDVSKTIEELLELNKLIPKRTNKPMIGTTQKQLSETGDYDGKKFRGESKEITELQFDHEDQEFQVVEIEAETKPPSESGHNSKTWETNDEKIRGHKDVSPLWQQVYKNEDERD